MKRSVFLILVGVTALALVLALLLSRPETVDPEILGAEPLIPGLREQVNDIDAIEVLSAGGSVSLSRSDERWRVDDSEGYEADFELVYQLLRDLASGERADQRTANPDWHARLGVADPGNGASEETGGVRISFPNADLPGLIIGRSGPAGASRFVRLVDQDQVWLSDRDIDVPGDVLGWLLRAIMDIPASELAEITLRQPDGQVIQLLPADEQGSQWVLMNVPDGREAEPAWRLNSVANALSNLQLDAVQRYQDAPEDSSSALFVTRDGLNFVATLWEDDDGGWVNFSVSAEVGASDADAALSEDEASASADAAAVDARLSPWAFQLPSAKYEVMTRDLEDLLVDPEDEDSTP